MKVTILTQSVNGKRRAKHGVLIVGMCGNRGLGGKITCTKIILGECHKLLFIIAYKVKEFFVFLQSQIYYVSIISLL